MKPFKFIALVGFKFAICVFHLLKLFPRSFKNDSDREAVITALNTVPHIEAILDHLVCGFGFAKSVRPGVQTSVNRDAELGRRVDLLRVTIELIAYRYARFVTGCFEQFDTDVYEYSSNNTRNYWQQVFNTHTNPNSVYVEIDFKQAFLQIVLRMIGHSTGNLSPWEYVLRHICGLDKAPSEVITMFLLCKTLREKITTECLKPYRGSIFGEMEKCRQMLIDQFEPIAIANDSFVLPHDRKMEEHIVAIAEKHKLQIHVNVFSMYRVGKKQYVLYNPTTFKFISTKGVPYLCMARAIQKFNEFTRPMLANNAS